ncbi:hypothetical protein D3C72_1594530 [compost metagenome]
MKTRKVSTIRITSSGLALSELKTLVPNWNRMPASMAAAIPLGMAPISLSKAPERPIAVMASELTM